jgi:hypothetical protein
MAWQVTSRRMRPFGILRADYENRPDERTARARRKDCESSDGGRGRWRAAAARGKLKARQAERDELLAAIGAANLLARTDNSLKAIRR